MPESNVHFQQGGVVVEERQKSLDGLIDAILTDLLCKVRQYLAFTALNIVLRSLCERSGSILDLGCGKGGPMEFIRGTTNFYVVGVDIFEPWLRKCKERASHNELILCDVRAMPIRNRSFDIVLCMEVIEHRTKEEGRELLKSIERIAPKQVIITTPTEYFIEYKQSNIEGNPYQVHKYMWSSSEFEKRSYRVKSLGIRGIAGYEGLASKLPKLFKPICYFIWILAGLLVQFHPSLGGHMVCIKEFSRNIANDGRQVNNDD